ncbi:hypothetical protein KCP73_17260 [Salmonella enterica subsp. enterica]|nr:hypothetical protein KCP73_17260 [Salmonella enterica subsp. enterica]
MGFGRLQFADVTRSDAVAAWAEAVRLQLPYQSAMPKCSIKPAVPRRSSDTASRPPFSSMPQRSSRPPTARCMA